MAIINQPHASTFGDILRDFLIRNQNCEGSKFYIVSAYAKRSGVERIQNPIEEFRHRGGTVIGIIGLDQRVTTIQALRKLQDLTDELYVYHSERLTQTFHPKVYVIETPLSYAVVFIGSSNLTAGGLYLNYEATYQKEYNLVSEEDRNEFEHVKQMIESYKDTTSPCCKLITDDLLDELVSQNYLSNEQVTINVVAFSRGVSREPIFGTERFIPPLPRVTTAESETGPVRTICDTSVTTQGFWKKLSPRFDVSLTSAPGQIQIPIRFLAFFPEFSALQVTPANASQAEAFFNVIFEDPLGQRLRMDGVRIIHYFPAPTHPRPNHELRFTFRNRQVQEQLQAGDILEFRRTNNPDIWFVIKLLKPSSDEHSRFSTIGRYGTIET